MRRWGAPAAALLIARLLSAAAALWAGVNPLRAETWLRLDSHLYLEIARKGYTLFPCPPKSGCAPSQWCGNAAWFRLHRTEALLAPIVVMLPARAAGPLLFAAAPIAFRHGRRLLPQRNHPIWCRRTRRRSSTR
jgi:hypothetical protein